MQLQCIQCGQSMFGVLGEVTIHPDRDEYEVGNPLATRGEWTEVAIAAEEPDGQKHRMIIANHKGAIMVGLVHAE